MSNAVLLQSSMRKPPRACLGFSPATPSRYAVPWLLFGSFVIALLYFAPTLGAGINGDLGSAYIDGYARVRGLHGTAALISATRVVEQHSGTWLPLRIVALDFWMWKPGPVLARALQCIVVALDVTLYALIVARLSRSVAFAALSIVGVLISLQLRKPHDGVLESTLVIPVALGLALIAISAFQRFSRTSTIGSLLLSLLAFFCACTTHEAVWPLAGVFALVSSGKRAFTYAALAFVLVPLAICVVGLALGLGYPASYAWLGNGFERELTRSATQILATLPGTYRGFDGLVRYGMVVGETDTRFWAFPTTSIPGILTTLSLATFGFFSAGTLAANRRPLPVVRMLVFALSFLGSTALCIDPLAWRRGMPLGAGVDADFIGCFGTGLLLALATRAIISRFVVTSVRLAVAPLVALIVAVVAYGNVRAEGRVVAIDRNRYESTRLIDYAGAAGIFRSIPRDAAIAFDGDPPLPPGQRNDLDSLDNLIAAAAGTTYRTISIASLRERSKACTLGEQTSCTLNRPVYIMRHEERGPASGGLTISRLTGLRQAALRVDEVFAVLQAPVSSTNGTSPHIAGLGLAARAIEGGKVIRVSRTCGSVAIDDALLPQRDVVEWASGFLPGYLFKNYQFAVTSILQTAPNGKQNWRYALRTSILRVRPNGCKGIKRVLHARVFSSSPARLSIAIGNRFASVSVSEAGTSLDLPLPTESNESVSVRFTTHAAAAPEELMYPPFDKRRFPAPSLLFVAPSVIVAETR